jgi:glycosyltransferase involved in cell wall biosynthesis
MKTVSIVIPTLNEAEAIAGVIRSIPLEQLECDGYAVDVVVIDGESTDDTAQIAREAGARVIVDSRKGKGMAIDTAFKKVKADYLIMLDGDNTYPAEHIPLLLEGLQTYDVVLGSRLNGQIDQGAITPVNLVGNYMLTGLANALYHSSISDLCTGFWGFRGYVTGHIQIYATGFDLEANIFSECVRHGFTIGEVPVHYRVRTATSKLKPSDGILIAESLLLNSYEYLRIARYYWLRMMYGHDLISGKGLYRRNISMGEAMSLKIKMKDK